MADNEIPPGVKIIGRIPAPGGGEWVLGDDGGVFAIGGAPYLGSYHGLAPEQKQGSRSIIGIEGTAEGGYRLRSSNADEAGYTFNPGGNNGLVPNNPLAGDPAYAAFLRTSGLALEVAAADTARRRMAIDSALGLDIPDIQEQGKREREGISGSFEARGFARSGERVSKLGEQETDEANAIARRRLAALQETQGLEQDLAARVAGTQREGAELGLSLLGKQYGSQQEMGLKNLTTKYEDELANLRRQAQQYGG